MTNSDRARELDVDLADGNPIPLHVKSELDETAFYQQQEPPLRRRPGALVSHEKADLPAGVASVFQELVRGEAQRHNADEHGATGS
jgi:hypothetical protein